MNNIELELLKQIADINETPNGAYNIRRNGQGIERKVTENVNVFTRIGFVFVDLKLVHFGRKLPVYVL